MLGAGKVWARNASGGSGPGPCFLDSKSGGQKICYPKYKTRQG
jgi:hypothetical protein